MSENHKQGKVLKHEEEIKGSVTKHPYLLYVAMTVVLFVFLLIMGYIALSQGWIPNRGVSAS